MPTPLSVLKSSNSASPEQLIRLFHQSQLEWARHIGDETELVNGQLIGNCLLGAYLVEGQPAKGAMADISAAHVDLCTLNPSVMTLQTTPIADALLANGWTPHSLNILHRQRIVDSKLPTPIQIKIIPARASYKHYRQLMDARGVANVDLAMAHLDDSHFDALLALKDTTPIGSIGVLTSGEVGTLREWYNTPDARQFGVHAWLLDRALEVCTRGVLRHVMIGLSQTATDLSDHCQSQGFAAIGQWTTFQKDSCKSGGLFA